MTWFRVSLSATEALLADAAPLCHGLAKYAGFDAHESSIVGDQLLAAIRKAQRAGTADLVDIVCRIDNGRFAAHITRGGQAIETIARPITRAV